MRDFRIGLRSENPSLKKLDYQINLKISSNINVGDLSDEDTQLV